MFFFFGIMNDQKNLNFHQPMTCDVCGRMGQYQVFVTYMVLSIFFIPIFKWGRTYYVRTSCCGSLYQLRPEVGRAIERGENATIQQTDLYLEQRGQEQHGKWTKVCYNCGYTTTEDFEYCPKCGKKFEYREQK